MADARDGGAGALPVFVGSWGGFGTQPGQFVESSSVDLERNGVGLVAEHESRVQPFTMDGSPLEIWARLAPATESSIAEAPLRLE